MKLLTVLISAMMLGATCSQASAQTIRKIYIRHYERIQNHALSFNNQGLPLKTERLSNNQGNIVLIYDDALPDSVQVALLAAKKLWESKISAVQPIFISVSFESLGAGVSMIADVGYCVESDLDGCPCALGSQIRNNAYGSIDAPDGCIVLNSDVDWNCRFTSDATSEYNLPTMILRGIARCLGFDSSIIENSEDSFSFFFDCPTYFENLLYYNSTALSGVEPESRDMAEFVTSDQVYARTKSQSYKIYAPNEFVEDMSLCYFDDTNSIISYSLGQGNIDLSIDDKTTNILRAIGWDLPLSGLSIQCDNITDDGIGSSYETHTFSLLKEDENVANYNWRFFLRNKQGNYTQISSGTTEDFTIDRISSPDNFYINVNGDLEGRIECDYYLDGKCYSAIPFALSLELKPVVLSIDDISAVNHGQYEFSLNFNVRYTGADYISVEIEEEYNTTLRSYRFDEPYIAHVKTGNITNLYYSWITIIASNEYGTACETIEYAPVCGSASAVDISSTFNKSLNSHILKEIALYNIDGILIFRGTPSEFESQLFNAGMYLKVELYDNGYSKTSKILFR